MTNKLYVLNPAASVTEEALRELFAPYGTVTKVMFRKQPIAGGGTEYAVIEMSDGGAEARAALAGAKLDGEPLEITEVSPVVFAVREAPAFLLEPRASLKIDPLPLSPGLSSPPLQGSLDSTDPFERVKAVFSLADSRPSGASETLTHLLFSDSMKSVRLTVCIVLLSKKRYTELVSACRKQWEAMRSAAQYEWSRSLGLTNPDPQKDFLVLLGGESATERDSLLNTVKESFMSAMGMSSRDATPTPTTDLYGNEIEYHICPVSGGRLGPKSRPLKLPGEDAPDKVRPTCSGCYSRPCRCGKR